MSSTLTVAPLTSEVFAPYGDVIVLRDAPDVLINQGLCGRHHDLAQMDFGGGRAGISLFDAKARQFPLAIDMVERHPLGSQAFIPMSGVPFLVVVADDNGGVPVNLKAFVTGPGQAINLFRNTWHGVLCPIEAPGLYAIIDRIGEGNNLEEHWFNEAYVVETAEIMPGGGQNPRM